jgi:tetratricopeptide (TPR) repeat protein
MLNTPRTLRVPAAFATGLVLAACAPAADRAPAAGMDAGVERFIAGDYAAAVEDFERVLATTDDDAVRREACTYLGRSQMALGRPDEAIAAFTLGVRHGDRGPCVEYLEYLKQYVEGSPGTLHTREVLTRAELAGALVRLMAPGREAAPGGPTPLALAASRGWMAASPDGGEHAGAPVTRAALHVVVARLLAQSGNEARAGEIMGGSYRSSASAADPVSGAEALAILERVRAAREQHGR